MKIQNFIGLYTLYVREIKRFLSVVSQTVMAPVITTLLFWLVFKLALGGNRNPIHGVDFQYFLIPGLAMMTMVQNAFANTSSSLIVAKLQKNIVDTLMAPLNAFELLIGYSLGGISRGLLVGCCVILAMSIFKLVLIHNIFVIILFALLACMMLSLLGIIAGIISAKFDHLGAFTNFVITPLSFLSGTFYSIDNLPKLGQILAKINPFFYMIDGFRYGFLGISDTNIWLGFSILLTLDLALSYLVYNMFKSGYKLKN